MSLKILKNLTLKIKIKFDKLNKIKNKTKINSNRKINCKIKRIIENFQKNIKAWIINLLKRKLKINLINKNLPLRMFLMISKALKLKFFKKKQVFKNSRIQNYKNN